MLLFSWLFGILQIEMGARNDNYNYIKNFVIITIAITNWRNHCNYNLVILNCVCVNVKKMFFTNRWHPLILKYHNNYFKNSN